MRGRIFLGALVAISLCVMVFLGLRHRLITSLEKNECDMTFMWPNLFQFHVQSPHSQKYSLHIYREGAKYHQSANFVWNHSSFFFLISQEKKTNFEASQRQKNGNSSSFHSWKRRILQTSSVAGLTGFKADGSFH